MDAFLPTWFVVVMAVAGLSFILVLGLVVTGFARAERGRRKLEREGIDPVTVIPEAVHNLGRMAEHSGRSAEQRLRELDRLRAEGLISAEEHDARRAEIIKEI